jgi:uncharacterized protein YcbK (DUF882 family)
MSRGRATPSEGGQILNRSTGFRSTGWSIFLALGLYLTASTVIPTQQADAGEGTRTLKLYHLHTKERAEFTYKRNGRYDKQELAKINRFLRDWRRNEPINMDPHLLDLVWSVYQASGSHDYIHVVCGYRSPATNSMLRSRSRGVAEKSQHMLGKAMDWFVTDVPLAKLRATAMKMQGGGVGYYPTSGSPFVHTDTGNVRAWPRMSRSQLLALFPNGETLHVPADGKPLPGYQIAMAKRKASGATALAYLDTGSSAQSAGKKGNIGNWLKHVFDADQSEDNEATGTAAAPRNQRRSQPSPPSPSRKFWSPKPRHSLLPACPARDQAPKPTQLWQRWRPWRPTRRPRLRQAAMRLSSLPWRRLRSRPRSASSRRCRAAGRTRIPRPRLKQVPSAVRKTPLPH